MAKPLTSSFDSTSTAKTDAAAKAGISAKGGASVGVDTAVETDASAKTGVAAPADAVVQAVDAAAKADAAAYADAVAQADSDSAALREGTRLKWLVEVSAALIGVLLIVFFMVVIQNARTVNDQVERVKNGPYPISVAVGHIETDLVRLETLIEHLTASQHDSSPDAGLRYENSFTDVAEDIQKQLDVIDPNLLTTPEYYDRFNREFDLLKMRLGVFTVMCWNNEGNPASYEETVDYAEQYLYPVISYLLTINNYVLGESTQAVDDMYSSVNAAISTMFIVALVMLVSVAIVVAIYMLLLRIKTRFENQLRESLAIALAEAREANKAKSDFLSNMSHDIRTPMNAIVGLTAIADENIDDKLRVKQCLTRITTSSQHLLSLINDVLDMNKIESGKVTMTEEEFSLESLVTEIEMIVKSQPLSHRLQIRVYLENVVHDRLIGDTMRLRQILLNLTSNALKYTNEGDKMVVLVRENPPKFGNARPGWADVTFIVNDTGIGMQQDFLERIFEPFERERNDFTSFTEGTGLGMAITKSLVGLMGGTIEVESELGVGTTVRFNIPFRIAESDAHAGEDAAIEKSVPRIVNISSDLDMPADSDASDGGATSSSTGAGVNAEDETPGSLKKTEIVSGRVLIAEDNEINMEIAQMLISARGADVEGAPDGMAALSAVRNAPEGYYDLIFMDWQMPHMNGIEATKAIRKHLAEHNLPQIPIVAMTANAFDSDRAEALAAGMDDFMTKPINIHALDETLKKYLKPGCDR